jgi:hypothetical protein
MQYDKERIQETLRVRERRILILRELRKSYGLRKTMQQEVLASQKNNQAKCYVIDSLDLLPFQSMASLWYEKLKTKPRC